MATPLPAFPGADDTPAARRRGRRALRQWRTRSALRRARHAECGSSGFALGTSSMSCTTGAARSLVSRCHAQIPAAARPTRQAAPHRRAAAEPLRACVGRAARSCPERPVACAPVGERRVPQARRERTPRSIAVRRQFFERLRDRRATLRGTDFRSARPGAGFLRDDLHDDLLHRSRR